MKNIENQFTRVNMLYGTDTEKILSKYKIAVCGLGGVGSYIAEALVRTGIQNIVIIDSDNVEITNINRQLIATHKTLGMSKVDAEANRLLEINPLLKIEKHKTLLGKDVDASLFKDCDYIADAIDNVTAKLSLIEYAYNNNINIISAMGCGNHIDITKLHIADIYKTTECSLCRVMRRELKKRNIPNLKVVFSTEPKKVENTDVIPSTVFVPAASGLMIASEIINSILRSESLE